jgi:hypothetical protein
MRTDGFLAAEASLIGPWLRPHPGQQGSIDDHWEPKSANDRLKMEKSMFMPQRNQYRIFSGKSVIQR